MSATRERLLQTFFEDARIIANNTHAFYRMLEQNVVHAQQLHSAAQLQEQQERQRLRCSEVLDESDFVLL